MKAYSVVLCAVGILGVTVQAQRLVENLDRGVVATRINANKAFVSWRLLALDPAKTSFNLYRSSNGSSKTRLNGAPLAEGTNFIDTTADLSKANTYFVTPVVDGTEYQYSAPFTLPANANQEPVLRVPIKTSLSGYATKFVWVGDLDGDGDYDFVLDRLPTTAGQVQYLEAYRNDGTFLWRVKLGPNSTNTNNIEPGSSTIDVGHWDGVTVYDFDSDGKAEVALRGSNGVTFGDGTSWTYSDDKVTFVYMLDGLTGTLRSWIKIPTDFNAAGPLAARFGVGYLDGVHPSLIGYMKNRNDDGSFNLMECAWRFTGSSIKLQWKYLRDSEGGADGHNTRIADIDGDGSDEVCEIGFCLESNGVLKYVLPIVHGDRWYIGKLDPDADGLQGYGIQQDNNSGLLDYYYNAATGEIKWKHSVDPSASYDVGRGDVGDLDPRYKGYEVWSFAENRTIFNGPAWKQTNTATAPWPSLRLWWDGDLLSEQINETKFEKWEYASGTISRLLTGYKFGASMGVSNWHAFYGDIIGDWREEVIFVNGTYDSLLIFTTQTPTNHRIYSLAQNPAYRNCMTLKGYNQSHLTDFYLGDGMSTPPTPKIQYIGASSWIPLSSSSSSAIPSSSSSAVSSSSVVSSSSSETPTAIPDGGQRSGWEIAVHRSQIMLQSSSEDIYAAAYNPLGIKLWSIDLPAGGSWISPEHQGLLLMEIRERNQVVYRKLIFTGHER